jgi:hypothetical protein
MSIIATGEVINQSVYQAGKVLAVQAVACLIVHWCSDTSPAPGAPAPASETVPTVRRAALGPEVSKMASAAHPQPAKPSESTERSVAECPESTKTTISFPWFPRATDTRALGGLENAVALGRPTPLRR